MRYPLAYFLAPLLAVLLVGGFYLGGVGYFALPIIAYGVFPPIDHRVGLSRWPSDKRIESLSKGAERLYLAALFISALVSLAVLGWALWAASGADLLWWQWAGLALSLGILLSLTGIVVAHELVHRKQPLANLLAWLIMAPIGYAHYPVEHVYSHHAKVGLHEDPVTARRGESVYAFALRSYFGGLREGWRIEAARLRRAGKSALSLSNRILCWQIFGLAVAGGTFWLLGAASFALLLAASIIAVFVFESVNYIEHYGLERRRGADGRLERIAPAHSWNASHVLTNVALFNAGRHADHHLAPRRPYYTLRHYDDAPQLPYGYAAMILIAALPPLWFRIMDRELDWFAARRRADARTA